jgi:hypothetical protein
MYRGLLSLIVLTGLLVLAAGHGSTSNLLAQTRGCPNPPPRVLKSQAEDPDGPTPAAQLMAYLADKSPGIILIPSNVTVEMESARQVAIASCVTLKGTRGGLDPGALITATNRDADGPVFSTWDQNVRIEGLRFRGPVTTDDRSPHPQGISIKAVAIMGNATATITNNVFEFWTVAVIVQPEESGLSQPSCPGTVPPVSITRNYFNRNANEDAGYGVGIHGGCVRVDGNLFNKNRHAVSSSGPAGNRQGYLAHYNYVLEGGFTVCNDAGLCYWNQHFDVHGSADDGYGGEAGEYFDIAWNTIRGEQGYYQTQTRPAFMLRGKPAIGAYFHDNVVVHDGPRDAVQLKKPGPQCLDGGIDGLSYSWELCNLHVYENRYNTDLINELAVGDFDGDGRDDVFLANGTAWWYSSAGRTEWRFLRPSTLRIRDLRFGNFTGDARTDVLYAAGPNWFVSNGGTGSGMWWRGDGTPLADCVFGDFDRDSVTDALKADSSTWSIASHANGPWVYRRDDWARAADLRVADFTNDRADDVFWIASNTWQVWDPVRNVVTRDHRKPVFDSDRPLLVVADFDGDGRADLAKSDADGWIWMRTGTTFWNRLRWNADQTEFNDIRAAVIGRFTIGLRADAIRYASSRFPDASKYGFVIWSGLQDAFVAWSPLRQEMR